MDRSWENTSSMKAVICKHITNRHLFVILSVMSAMLLCLMILLYMEYRYFYQQSRAMIQLQNQYYNYIKEVKKMTGNQFDFPDASPRLSGCASDEGMLVPLNRAAAYLKESAEDYYREQEVSLSVDHTYEVPRILRTDSTVHKPRIVQKIPKKKVFRTTRYEKSYDIFSRATIDFLWPIERESFWVSSYYGPRKKNFHYGLDMAAARGTPVRPAAAGIIEQAGYVSGYGNMVTVTHNKMYKTRYAHLDQITAKLGQPVRTTDVIGMVGDTGFTIKTGTDASHLHFEVCEHGKQINPLHVLPRS